MSADLVNLARAGWSSNAVSAILVDHEIRWSTLTEDSSDALRGWAGVLRSVFTAADLEELCAVTNGLLERGTSRAYLTIHDRLRRTYISFPMRKTSLPVRAVTSGGLALFLVESGGDRLGACGRDGCGLVFVDTSRNGRRAYCSSRCGNYVAVTRHRQELQR